MHEVSLSPSRATPTRVEPEHPRGGRAAYTHTMSPPISPRADPVIAAVSLRTTYRCVGRGPELRHGHPSPVAPNAQTAGLHERLSLLAPYLGRRTPPPHRPRHSGTKQTEPRARMRESGRRQRDEAKTATRTYTHPMPQYQLMPTGVLHCCHRRLQLSVHRESSGSFGLSVMAGSSRSAVLTKRSKAGSRRTQPAKMPRTKRGGRLREPSRAQSKSRRPKKDRRTANRARRPEEEERDDGKREDPPNAPFAANATHCPNTHSPIRPNPKCRIAPRPTVPGCQERLHAGCLMPDAKGVSANAERPIAHGAPETRGLSPNTTTARRHHTRSLPSAPSSTTTQHLAVHAEAAKIPPIPRASSAEVHDEPKHTRGVRAYIERASHERARRTIHPTPWRAYLTPPTPEPHLSDAGSNARPVSKSPAPRPPDNASPRVEPPRATPTR
jgi:hypothetical protein